MAYRPKPIISSSSLLGGQNAPERPKIDKITLSTAKFVWLHHSAWDNAKPLGKLTDFHVFYNGRLLADKVLCAPPPYSNNKLVRHAPSVAARWILKSRDGRCLAWAEAHTLAGEFASVNLLFGLLGDVSVREIDMEFSAAEAFAMLTSACLVVTDANILNLFPATQVDEEFITSVSDFCPKGIWVPYGMSHRSKAGRFIKIGFIETVAWWESSLGANAAKQVSYLKHRLENLKREEQKRKAPPKRRFSLMRTFFPRLNI